MQTRLAPDIADTPEGREAEAILRSCVHCGFCNATCPTYQLLGDERDGPRGRIYLIKQVLEGHRPGNETRRHLDRCLSCRSCETTCPSGVQYGRLADIGRAEVERQLARPPGQFLLRKALVHTVPYPKRFAALLRTAQLLKPVLPAALTRQLVPLERSRPRSPHGHPRRMLVLEGCVQSVSSPATNEAAARVLNHLGIDLLSASDAGCCGALSHHLSESAPALAQLKRNIDAWWPHIEQGAEAIIITASGCGSMIKDYGHLLRDDPDYADRAARIAALSRDLIEVLEQEIGRDQWSGIGSDETVAFHSPCSLQHGQRLGGRVESLLQRLGFNLTPVPDSHLCCGSAGSYSLMQPVLSRQLRDNKLAALDSGAPDRIVSANIGCQLHLSRHDRPVRHWVELLAEKLDHALE